MSGLQPILDFLEGDERQGTEQEIIEMRKKFLDDT